MSGKSVYYIAEWSNIRRYTHEIVFMQHFICKTYINIFTFVCHGAVNRWGTYITSSASVCFATSFVEEYLISKSYLSTANIYTYCCTISNCNNKLCKILKNHLSTLRKPKNLIASHLCLEGQFIIIYYILAVPGWIFRTK